MSKDGRRLSEARSQDTGSGHGPGEVADHRAGVARPGTPPQPDDPFAGLNGEPVPSDPDTVTVETTPTEYIIRSHARVRVYPRVTTVLQSLSKPALVPWAAKVVAEYAVRHLDEWRDLPIEKAIKRLKTQPDVVRDRAADRGKVVHQAIEAWAGHAKLPDMTDDEAACYWQARRFLLDHDVRIDAVELVLFSDKYRYAGTGDFFMAEIPRGSGKYWLLDWKTSKNIWPEHELQLAAYLGTDHMVKDGEIILRGLFMAWPTHAGIVHLRPDSYTLHKLRGARALHDVFVATRQIHEWRRAKHGNGLRRVETLERDLEASLTRLERERVGQIAPEPDQNRSA